MIYSVKFAPTQLSKCGMSQEYSVLKDFQSKLYYNFHIFARNTQCLTALHNQAHHGDRLLSADTALCLQSLSCRVWIVCYLEWYLYKATLVLFRSFVSKKHYDVMEADRHTDCRVQLVFPWYSTRRAGAWSGVPKQRVPPQFVWYCDIVHQLSVYNRTPVNTSFPRPQFTHHTYILWRMKKLIERYE